MCALRWAPLSLRSEFDTCVATSSLASLTQWSPVVRLGVQRLEHQHALLSVQGDVNLLVPEPRVKVLCAGV